MTEEAKSELINSSETVKRTFYIKIPEIYKTDLGEMLRPQFSSCQKKKKKRELPGSPVLRTQRFPCHSLSLVSGGGTKISQNKEKEKTKMKELR